MTVIYISNEADNNDLMHAVAATDGNYSYCFFVVSKINDSIIIKTKLLTYLHADGAEVAQPV